MLHRIDWNARYGTRELRAIVQLGDSPGGIRAPGGPQRYVPPPQCDFARGGRPMRGQTFNNGHSGQRGFRAVQTRRP